MLDTSPTATIPSGSRRRRPGRHAPYDGALVDQKVGGGGDAAGGVRPGPLPPDLLHDYAGTCWWRVGIADSREHKYKKSDLVREFGAGPWQGADGEVPHPLRPRPDSGSAATSRASKA